MFGRAQILLVALVLAGCAGPQRKVTPLRQQGESIAPPVEPPKTLPSAALTGWVLLKNWCSQNGLAEPKISISATSTNVEIGNSKGIFAFEPPRRNARWNGVLIGMGFPLQITNGAAFAHALDLEKVVRPLMVAAPARKPGGIVVIDAGHGGENMGARSHDKKAWEKEMTLDWARRVQKLLSGSQWRVEMTREADMDLTLTQRVAFAEMKKADLFISLHFNSFSTQDEAGLETYCITPQGMSSHLTRGYPDEIESSLANNRYDIENLALAHDLHVAMLKKTGRKDRGVRRARFMTVLREQKRPAVLLEGGYLSNPEEAELIEGAEYRQKLAEAVAEALGVVPATTSPPGK